MLNIVVIRELQIRTMKYCLYLIEWLKSKTLIAPNAEEIVE